MSSKPKIALVGHCGPDAYMLRSAIKHYLQDSEVTFINDFDTLVQAIEDQPPVLLVNRVLDYAFDIRSGVELIKELKTKSPDLRAMLISDYADAQADAEKAGALPGFGKSQVGSSKMKDALSGLVK